MVKVEEKILELVSSSETELSDIYRKIDTVSEKNTAKVMAAFNTHHVSEALFASSSGYGYGDRGRDVLDLIYADVFEAESAFVRHSIVNGTQALSIGLFGLLRPGDILYSVSGKPYDTLEEVIGIAGNAGDGSLRDFGVEYRQTELIDGKDFDFDKIDRDIAEFGDKVKVVFIQRSRGYMTRKTLSSEKIGELVKFVKARIPDVYVFVDNCYGEFVEEHEPTYYGADVIVGSLIKNPGGGMAESGGYIAGSAKAVELASYRLTSVGIGCECGATLGQNKSMYKGFFYAPHTTAQALKTAVFTAYIFEKLGFDVSPKYNEDRVDIIQTVTFGEPQGLIDFCKGIQKGSPVDSFVDPEPWEMPGYSDKVIMAAGAFTQGSSIELSADGPLRPPFTAFMQGGLTFESGKLGIISAARQLLTKNE